MTCIQLPSVVKQCEKASINGPPPTISTSTAGTSNQVYRGCNTKNRLPSTSALKLHPCHTFHKFEHWKDIHNKDGSLQPGIKCYDTAAKYSAFPNSSGRSSNSNNTNNANGKKKLFLSTWPCWPVTTVLLKFRLQNLVKSLLDYSWMMEHLTV